MFQFVKENKYILVDNEVDALNIRLSLLEKEKKEIFASFHIWDGSKIGGVALASLIQNARSAVKVRVFHEDTYQDYTKELEGIKRYRSNPELRTMIEESYVKNLAQIYTKIKYTIESHLKYLADVHECLKKQGFINSYFS